MNITEARRRIGKLRWTGVRNADVRERKSPPKRRGGYLDLGRGIMLVPVVFESAESIINTQRRIRVKAEGGPDALPLDAVGDGDIEPPPHRIGNLRKRRERRKHSADEGRRDDEKVKPMR